MRLALALALAASGALLPSIAAAAPFEEPVGLAVRVPPMVATNSTFMVRVDVEADAGALDIAAQPLRLRARLAAECGGSFAGTEGPTAIDRVLPAPSPGASYAATASGEVRLGSPGAETVCAFLEDAQERQFATSTEETLVAISAACASSGHSLARLRRRRTRLGRHLDRLRQVRHRRQGHADAALARRIRAIRRRRQALRRRERRELQRQAASCGAAR